MRNKIFILLAFFALLGFGCSQNKSSEVEVSLSDNQVKNEVNLSGQVEKAEVEEILKKSTEAVEKSATWEIEDYFLNIPAKYIPEIKWGYIEDTKENRLELLKKGYEQFPGSDPIVDKDNYYIRLTGSESWYTMTVFTRGPKLGVVAIEFAGCGPMCSQELYFIENNKGVWVERKDLVPKIEVEAVEDLFWSILEKKGLEENNEQNVRNYLYILPRYGVVIRAEEVISGIDILRMKWNGVDSFDIETF